MKDGSLKRMAALIGVLLLVAIIVTWSNYRPAGEADGAPMVSVQVPPLEPAEIEGRQAYTENCAQCHGDNAAGRNGIAPPLVHRIYQTNHHGDAAFQLAVKNGVRAHHWRFGDMPAIEDVSSEQIDRIIAYVRALQRTNGIK